MHTGEILPLPPVLLGKIGKDSKKKTLLIYGHLDVQPALKSDGLVRKFFNRNIVSIYRSIPYQEKHDFCLFFLEIGQNFQGRKHAHVFSWRRKQTLGVILPF